MAFADAQLGCTVISSGPAFKVTAAGAVSRGDVLGYDDGWVRALATVETAIQPRLVALDHGAAGDLINVAPFAVLGGTRFSGATAGALIYAAEGSAAGEYTETQPDTSGDVDVAIGFALDATTIFVNPAQRGPDSVA